MEEGVHPACGGVKPDGELSGCQTRRYGDFFLVVWMIDLHNLIIPPREHASHVLQVGRCRPQSEAQTGDSTRKRGRNAENPTGGRVG